VGGVGSKNFVYISQKSVLKNTLFWEKADLRLIVISNKNGKLFLLKLTYSKEYLSQSKLK
jgi:hypothetical protein